jgi:hypothetical protein
MRRVQDGVGPALERVGSVTRRIGDQIQANDEADAELSRRETDKMKAENDAINLTRARSDWTRRRLAEEDKANPEVNPDYSKWEPTYTANIRKQREEAAKAINDPKLRERFLAETDDDIARGTFSIRDRARTVDRGRREAEAITGIESDMAAAAKPGLPQVESDAIMGRVRASIDNLVTTGVWTPEKAIMERQRLAKRYAGLKVASDIQSDPSNAYRNLEGGPGEIYFSKLRRKESGGSDTAKASTSSAQGRFQFTDATWAAVRAAHPELGLTADGRTSGEQQERAIRAFTQDNTQALQAAGIPVNEANLYLAHFMGAGGAVKMLKADPGDNAAALFPEAAKANPTIFFTPDGVARPVGEVVALQTKGFDGMGGPAPEYYAILDPEDRMRLSASAQAEWASREKASREASQLEIYNVRSAIDDDVAQITETGTPTDLDPQRIVNTLGEDDAAKWLDRRRAAAETYEAVSVIPSMTNDEIEAHLDELEPEAGAENFERRQKTFDAAEKKAKAVQDLRAKDPAKAVEDSPLVKKAEEGYDPARPETIQPVIRARLAAQEMIGIPPALRNPITKKEAYAIINPVQAVIDGLDATVMMETGKVKESAARRAIAKQAASEAEAQMRSLLDEVEKVYGPYSNQVMAYAIGQSVNDREVGNMAARVLTKVRKGIRPSTDDMEALAATTEAGLAEKAMDGQTPPAAPAAPAAAPSPATPRVRAQTGQTKPPPAAPAGGWPAPPPPAVQDLITGGVTPAVFDAKYGPGSAARWMPKN